MAGGGGGVDRSVVPRALAYLALGLSGCVVSSGQTQPVPDAQGGHGGSADGGFSAAAGAPSLVSAAGDIQINPALQPCSATPLQGQPVFRDQIFNTTRVARRQLFSWTTPEQAAALRQDRILFSRSERPGLGPGYAFEVIRQIGKYASASEQAQLAAILAGALFEKARYAWPEPWATRMGWPGEDYGNELLRIVLKPEAWVVLVKSGTLSVYDLQNAPVSLAEALASPGRIGAIFYQKDAYAGGPNCDGSFAFGSNGYREFIVGNLAMVEEWSLGTQQIRDHLAENIAQLSAFLERIRSCPVRSSALSWNLTVACDWDRLVAEPSELFAYEQALAIPSDNYLAVPERIAAMIETLQNDLFEADTLVVTPGSP